MKKPKAFGGNFGVLNKGTRSLLNVEKYSNVFSLFIAMVIIVVLYVGMGLFGYLRFGDQILGSITLNLPRNEMWGIFYQILEPVTYSETHYRKAQAVQGMLAFSIFITHGLACYVAIDITWNEYLAKRFPNNTSFWEYVTRTLLVFATCKPESVNNVTFYPLPLFHKKSSLRKVWRNMWTLLMQTLVRKLNPQ